MAAAEQAAGSPAAAPAASPPQQSPPPALLLELPPPPLPPGRVLRRAFARAVGSGNGDPNSSPRFPRVYVLMHGAGRSSDSNTSSDPEAHALTPRLLDELRILFAAATAAGGGAALDVVPLLPFAGWGSAESVAELPDARAVLSLRRGGGDTSAADSLNAARQEQGLSALEALEWGNGDDEQTTTPAPPPTTTTTTPPLSFPDVAVGGTFDRLHAGHRLLLAATALAAQRHVFAGVTSDALLANKARRELLQAYEERAAAAERYCLRVRPGLSVRTGALRDPKEPTQAELDPEMQALVVSRETVRGGEAINEGRRARGFAPLELVVVGLVGGGGEGGGGGGGEAGGGGGGDDENDTVDVAGKISSTALREREAEAAEAAAEAARRRQD